MSYIFVIAFDTMAKHSTAQWNHSMFISKVCRGLCKLTLFFSISYSGVLVAGTPSTDNTHYYQLSNGLQLIVREDHRAPVAVFQIWYKVGSRDEARGHTGISHFLEHLMFKGTEKNPDDTFSVQIAENGGDQNAATSHDYTFYYQELEAARLPLSFALEADRMAGLRINADDVDTEREVVKEERRLRTEDNPNAMLVERFYANSYISSGYHHPIIGWMEDIDQISLVDLKRWYHRWYAPNNAVVVVAGDVIAEDVYALAKKTFGKLNSKRLEKRKLRSEQPVLGSKGITVNLPAKLPQLLLGYLTPTIVTAGEQSWEPYALAVLSSALGEGDSSRLVRKLVNHDKQAIQINTYYDLIGMDQSLFTISAIPADKVATPKLKKAILSEIKKLQLQPLAAADLARIKAGVIADEVYRKDSLIGQASLLGQLAVVGLPWQLDYEFAEKIKAVTADQVQQVAKKYLNSKFVSSAYLKPTKGDYET